MKIDSKFDTKVDQKSQKLEKLKSLLFKFTSVELVHHLEIALRKIRKHGVAKESCGENDRIRKVVFA